MTTVVYKETIHLPETGDEITLNIPAFAEILTVAKQFDNDTVLSVWYRCCPDTVKVDHKLWMCGTGHPAPNKSQARYISTVILFGGSLVLHFFEPVT